VKFWVRSPRIYGLARVKNEGDIIEDFVRHNLQYLDGLIVLDNASFDGTLGVLTSLQAERLPLTIIHEPTVAKRQAEVMTQATRDSLTSVAWDFLFLLDADEFILCRNRHALKKSLRTLPHGSNGLLPWISYVPTANDPDQPRVLKRICYRRAREAVPFSKVVISRFFAEANDFAVTQGNHDIVAGGVSHSEPMSDCALAHFPVRSLSQIQNKALLGWAGYLAMGYDGLDLGYQQRRLFSKLESKPIWEPHEFYDIALHYFDLEPGQPDDLIHAPLTSKTRWRYGDVSLRHPLSCAIGYIRQLTSAIAKKD
jgi:hypothetical protein